MNIEQIQSDLANGVIVSPGTWSKLVKAAQMMQAELQDIARWEAAAYEAHLADQAIACLKKVEAL